MNKVLPPDRPFPVPFSCEEFDSLSLMIPRARALADILQLCSLGNIDVAHIQSCLAMLFEILSEVNGLWEEATNRMEK